MVISIIDDDESVRVATENLIRSLGFGACSFSSAEEFLRSARLNDTCCLITDVQMPGMTGVELQSYLLERDHELPIIFITAFPVDRVRQKVHAAGAVGFLGKPFDSGAMIQCIDKALSQRLAAMRH